MFDEFNVRKPTMGIVSNTSVELELTFLARELPAGLHHALPQRIVDIYIPASVAHPCLRLRQRGGTYEITKKVPIDQKDSSRQTEQTIPLDAAEFETLRQVQGRAVIKDRYAVELAGRPAEVDVFRGDLEGLVLIDFEFDSDLAMRSFSVPKCCLADVTQEAFIAGGVLAGKRYAELVPALAQYGYEPLFTAKQRMPLA